MPRTIWTMVVTVLASIACALTGSIASYFRRSRGLGDWLSRRWSAAVLGAAGARLEVVGRDHLRTERDVFVVSNHQSALDIPILFRLYRGRVRFVAKESLFRIPIFGWYLRRYEFTALDRSSPREAVRAVTGLVERLREDPRSYVIFPEGTRSVDGKLLPFRRGALKVCARARLPLQPVVIDGSVRVVQRGRWRVKPGVVRLTVLPEIPAEEVAALSQDELFHMIREVFESTLGERPTPAIAAAQTDRPTEGVGS